mgnify:FL=1
MFGHFPVLEALRTFLNRGIGRDGGTCVEYTTGGKDSTYSFDRLFFNSLLKKQWKTETKIPTEKLQAVKTDTEKLQNREGGRKWIFSS